MARTAKKKALPVSKQLEHAFSNGYAVGNNDGQVLGYRDGRAQGINDALLALGLTMIVIGLIKIAVEGGK